MSATARSRVCVAQKASYAVCRGCVAHKASRAECRGCVARKASHAASSGSGRFWAEPRGPSLLVVVVTLPSERLSVTSHGGSPIGWA